MSDPFWNGFSAWVQQEEQLGIESDAFYEIYLPLARASLLEDGWAETDPSFNRLLHQRANDLLEQAKIDIRLEREAINQELKEAQYGYY